MLVAVIATAGEGGGSDGSGGKAHPGHVTHENGGHAKAPASYIVQNGDTLTSIAHRTGVSVARIQALNPEVDPQILISGEELKLR